MWTHDQGTGYGRMGNEIAKALEEHGIEVIDGLSELTQVAPVALWMSLPNNANGWYKDQYRVLLTMWEATRLPETVREGLDNFDLILVPSRQNEALYSRYHPAVHYVPLGFDPEVWAYRKRPSVDRTFRFLADGRGGRKGTDLAVEAFKKAFQGRKTTAVPQLMLKGNRAAVYANRDIRVMSSVLTAKEEVELYASAHVFLAPARGEGWGLQPLQAIAQGIPTILSDAHGHAAFAGYGWGLKCHEVPADYFVFGDAGNWWEPDLDQMISYMRWMYDNYDAASDMAQMFSGDAHERFTWRHSAYRIYSRIEWEMEREWTGTFKRTEWQTPVYKLYPVITRLPWRCQIAGTVYIFEPGKLYHETADVKRILFEAGLLDPACLEVDGEDNGLNPTQLAQVDAVTAQHGCCPTCGQELNSKPLYELEEATSH